MKTFRMIGMALVAVMLSFAMSSCENDDEVDPYKDYPQLIVGKWFNFTPEASVYMEYKADGTYYQLGTTSKNGWIERVGTYEVKGNKVNGIVTNMDNTPDVVEIVELSNDKFVIKTNYSEIETHYRIKESFDIKGNYSYLNSAVRIVPAEGKTALQLPEGLNFNGQNSIPVEMLQGDRIVNSMKKFFADATFEADGKLYYTVDNVAKVRNYTLDGNNLTLEFNLYEGGSCNVNNSAFPDEDGDRLFIIFPKQTAWLACGMVPLVEKENEGLKLDAAQIAALEKEFMDTFETFTVILSLSKK